MGRELQKKKNKSGISKARPKPKSKKRLLQHPIIAANWDKTQTLSQNYKRLGLTSRLNKSTGGVEKNGSDVAAMREMAEGDEVGDIGVDELVVAKRRKAEKVEVREARIEREEGTGRILRVVDEMAGKANPLNDLLNDLDSESDEADRVDQHATHTSTNHDRQTQHSSDVVRKLEQEAARPVHKYKPKQSENERAFVAELVAKYGEDYSKMARDVKINYMQRSEGDLKRRVKRWREGGGKLET